MKFIGLLLWAFLQAGQAYAVWSIPVTAGLVLWLDSNQGVTKDGSDNVSLWADQSGLGNHCYMNTAGLQPLWVANQYDGRPWILANNDGLTSTASLVLGANPLTVLVLQKAFPANNQSAFHFGPDAVAGCAVFSITEIAVWGWTGGCDVAPATAFGNVGTSTVQVNTQTWTGVNAAGQTSRYRDINFLGTDTGRAFNLGAGYGLFGSIAGVSHQYYGPIIEVAVYNRVLSSAEIADVVNWMQTHRPPNPIFQTTTFQVNSILQTTGLLKITQ